MGAALAAAVSAIAQPALMAGAGFVFVPDTLRLVAVETDRTLRIGRLDRQGVFHATQQIAALGGSGEAASFYSGPLHVVINPPELRSAPDGPQLLVYEYRSGALVPGRLNASGAFEATMGEPTVRLKDYRFDAAAGPIWNLPGKLRPSGWQPAVGWKHANLWLPPGENWRTGFPPHKPSAR